MHVLPQIGVKKSGKCINEIDYLKLRFRFLLNVANHSFTGLHRHKMGFMPPSHHSQTMV